MSSFNKLKLTCISIILGLIAGLNLTYNFNLGLISIGMYGIYVMYVYRRLKGEQE